MGIIFRALAVLALGCVAAWTLGLVLTLLSLRLLWLAANRRTVTDYLHRKPGAD
ncbi:hypothetical protein ACIA5G_22430 [Amycolatopsis sp. NPDC051758]|uniref:hypothetical protein n=1 Tax=Amycolatopsis sp. NPDC051758 TaxID=3363935 RepID=UPI0037A65674